jgi:hypothetical protein
MQVLPTKDSEFLLLRSPKASEGSGGAIGEAEALKRGNTVGVRDQVMDLVSGQGLNRRTVTYCQYGDDRMKPTDIWGDVPNWHAKDPCKNGDDCHVAAPRGSTTGTQGLKNAKLRSMIPYSLGQEILEAINK